MAEPRVPDEVESATKPAGGNAEEAHSTRLVERDAELHELSTAVSVAVDEGRGWWC
jgi:hypothetical protein